LIIFLQEFVLQLFLWMLQLVDGIMDIFSAITGVSKVTAKGESVNILEYTLGDSTVGTIFWCVFILAVGLVCIFTITALIKNVITNQRTVSTIVGKFFLSLLGTLAMLSVVVLAVMIANSLLTLVAEIFQIGNTTKLSNALFNACVGDWLNGYSIAEVDISSLSVRDIFGDYDASFFGIWPKSWKCNGMVNPNTFLYFPSLIAGIALCIALIVATVNLAKRIYEIVILYMVMPVSMSTLPLDDGARFKVWRETFVTKMVIAYGAVFSVNIFVLILPLISGMRVEGLGSFGNAIFLIFMIIGGAMVIPAGQALFARLFGQPDDMHAGGGFLHTAFYGTRFATMASLGVVSKILHGGAKGVKGIAHKIHNRKSSDGGNEDSGSRDDTADEGDKYEEENSPEQESSGE